MYGVTYAYLLHHIANIVVAWLVAVHFFINGFSIPSLTSDAAHSRNRAQDNSDDSSPVREGQVKKLP